MGQSQVTRAGGAVDTVITNALIVDHTGIYKADIGLNDGRIAGIGKAGNPDIQPGVDIIVGPGTESIAAEGKIVTAGGLDVISILSARSRSTMRSIAADDDDGRRHRPGAGTNATTCTPGAWHIGADAPGRRSVSDESRFLRQGQRVDAERTGRTDQCWRLRAQTA